MMKLCCSLYKSVKDNESASEVDQGCEKAEHQRSAAQRGRYVLVKEKRSLLPRSQRI